MDKKFSKVHIRWMSRRDMPEVLDIESKSFESPWIEEDFFRCLRQRNVIGMVAEHREKILGYMIYELHKKSLEILNFAIFPGVRRQGVGTAMVRKLIGKLTSHNRSKITINVRESNLPAQLFFKSQDFRAEKVLRRCYQDTEEDAYVFKYNFFTADINWWGHNVIEA